MAAYVEAYRLLGFRKEQGSRTPATLSRCTIHEGCLCHPTAGANDSTHSVPCSQRLSKIRLSVNTLSRQAVSSTSVLETAIYRCLLNLRSDIPRRTRCDSRKTRTPRRVSLRSPR